MTHFYPQARAFAALFLSALISISLVAQDTQEFFQGFEGAVDDTWGYTVSPSRYVADGGNDVWADTSTTSAIQPATGQKFWFMRDLENVNGGNDSFHIIDFEPIDVSGFGSNAVTFKYYTVEYEDSDSIGYILETSAGAGFDMANYVPLNRNTNAWETVFINLPPGASVVRLRLMAKQNGTTDYAGFDDVSVFSSTEDIIQPLVLQAELTGANSVRVVYSEPMDTASVENPLNYTVNATIDTILYSETGDGASYADIVFTEDFAAGQSYSLSVGMATDIAGNFLLVPFTFDFIYNNTTPSLVITEIFYHPPTDEGQEFIELYNAGDSTAALGGLQASGEFSFTFPAGLSLPAGGVLLLAYNEAVAEAFFGVDFLGWGATDNLGNGGGDLIITNFSGAVIDEVNYNDTPPWPTDADGGGPSLELIDATLDNNEAASWVATATRFANTNVFATPGTISAGLTPLISFVDAAVAVEEGAGRQSIALMASNPSMTAQAIITVASASTAEPGVDYILESDTITFPAGSFEPQFVNLDILDNASLGGRYLIIEIAALVNSNLGGLDKATVLIKDNDITPPAPLASPRINLLHLGSYESGGSAEIVAHDPGSQRLFVANPIDNRLDIIDFSDPSSLGPVNSIDLSVLFDGAVRCVAVHDGVVAVAMADRVTGNNGRILFFETNGFLQSSVEVGALPDMLVFTPDGSKLLVANEGEPRSNYSFDPEGSACIIDMAAGVGNMLDSDVTTVSFATFNADSASLVAQGVRIFGPGATVAQDLEPEYITISDDGATAYVVCQENNALVVIDIETATATAILPLGYKDWSSEGLLFDASDRSPDAFFANWPVKGMYQPDAIDFFTVDGQPYLITANEGSARNYNGFNEEFRVGDDEIGLDSVAFPNAAYLKQEELLGRLFVTNAAGDLDGDGDYDELYTFGGRSFSIWNAGTGELVYDSGSDIEVIIAHDPVFGPLFNADENRNEAKARSDDRGPEPEAVTVGVVDGVPYAFVGLERIGGIMAFDLSDPAAPQYVQYINTRNLNFTGGDLSPEDVIFITPEDSPNGKSLLVASYEASGTVAVFEAGTGATVRFASASTIVPEGSGRLEIEVQVEVDGALAGAVNVNVINASTAVAGVDYTIANTSLVFPEGSSEPQFITLDILNNDTLGGRYLILELERPDGSLLLLGEETRHIILIQDADDTPPAAQEPPRAFLSHLGSYHLPDGAAAGIIAHDAGASRLFVANSNDNNLEILDFSDPANIQTIARINLDVFGGIHAVDTYNGLVAVAVQGDTAGAPGQVLFLDMDGVFISSATVGVLPDMLLFSPDGSKVLTANEGEPSEDYTVDPEGSVSIIDISAGAANPAVTTLDFTAFNSQQASLAAQGVRIFGPGATVAQDLEPEYIALSDDGAIAYVVCQENNALVLIDLAAPEITAILPLGYKDWSVEGVSLDVSDLPGGVFFANWPIKGMYQPDAIDYFTVGGQAYLITANEGDARDYSAYSEAFRIGEDEIVLDPAAFPQAEYLKEGLLLGRLRISSASGDTDGDGDYDQLYAFGGRSFTIRDAATGEVVYDSGNSLEQITAADPVFGGLFNTDDQENTFKNRSDDMGPEPEALTVAEIDGTPYAFIGLERMGGVVMYDLTDPASPEYVQYINTRTVDAPGGDLSPEDVIYISPEDSPTGQAYVLASYLASGSVAVFEVATAPTIGFAGTNSIIREGFGEFQVALEVEQVGRLAGEATVSVISASTAVEGEDFTIATATVAFEAGVSDPQTLKINILDNIKLGGRYLILEIDAAASSAIVGEKTRHILLIQDNDDRPPVAPADSYLQMNYLGSYATELGSSMEIVDYDEPSRRLFVTNPNASIVEILDYSNPAGVVLVDTFSITPYGGGVNSVAVRNGVVAVAVQGYNTGENGKVVFFDTDGTFLNEVTVGALPDRVVFSPDGTKVLTANEGEPSGDYTIDPEGSVSIIDISGGVAGATVATVGFEPFNSQQASLMAQGVRIFGPNATVAQDLEPEDITISDDGATAYVTCQENNALAVVDLASETATAILPLGYKDWTQTGEAFDASDLSGDIFSANWPVKGMYHPDGIDYFSVEGEGYLITANEGHARDYEGFSEQFRVADNEIELDPVAFPDAEYLKEEVLLGRLRVSSATGDTDGDGDYDELYTYGGRSFAIWNAATGALVFDSGGALEQITAADPVFGPLFNTDDAENLFKNRSDDKGPEPEAVVVAKIDGRQFAFIALERMGGIVVYDVSQPAAPEFIQYINTRTANALGGDLSPEGLAFIPASASPTGRPMLAVAYEVSGTVGMFELQLNCPITSLPAEAPLCGGETATLLVSGTYEEIVWSTGEMGPSIEVDIPGAYTVTAVTESGCMAMNTVLVSPRPLPVVGLGEDIVACEGETVTIDAGPGFATYSWSSGAVDQSIIAPGQGLFTVTVTNEFGCSDSDTIRVELKPLPMVNFPQDTLVCAEDATVFDPGDGSLIIIDGILLETFVVEGFAPGDYSLEAVVVNEFGCRLPVELNFTVDVCVGAEEITQEEAIEVFPNPTSGWVWVHLRNLRESSYQLQVLDAAGRVVRQSRILPLQGSYQAEIGLTALPAGAYLVRLVSGNGLWAKRLIIE
ncbi:MAG: choice-of-anchor I family protein [Lewinellaceae bacterium]|nr:choice-of-anchor I family protein [Lewinellaceae bacterium]